MKRPVVSTVLIASLVVPVILAAETGLRRPPGLQIVGECRNLASPVANFVDPNLEAAVRTALSLNPGDEPTCEQVSGLTELTAFEADIVDLRGIEALAALRELHLDGNPVTDLQPLSDLPSLEALYLWGGSVRDLTPLRGLTELTILHIGNNSIDDITPLSALVQLRDLSITHNAVSDLGPLAGLTNLEVLRVYNNPISDISALRELSRLTELHIHDLPDLSNIEPLLENRGLRNGDRVILMRSDISCGDAAALRAKGVTVRSACLAGIPTVWWRTLGIAGGMALMLALVRRLRRAAGRTGTAGNA